LRWCLIFILVLNEILFVASSNPIPTSFNIPSYSVRSVPLQYINQPGGTAHVNHQGQNSNDYFDTTLRVELPQGFSFYQTIYNSFYLHVDGGIQFSSAAIECPPSSISNNRNVGECVCNSCSRNAPAIIPLNGNTNYGPSYLNGNATFQYYSTCPLSSRSVVHNEPCSIIAWNAIHFNSGSTNIFEVILYHSSSDFIIQYGRVGVGGGCSSSIGFFPLKTQNNANDFVNFMCNVALDHGFQPLQGLAFWAQPNGRSRTTTGGRR